MKGTVIVWLQVLFGIFIIGAVYIIFSYVLYSDVAGIANIVNTSTINSTQAQSTISIVSTVWRWWPLPLIVGLIIYGIVASQRREPDSYYY